MTFRRAASRAEIPTCRETHRRGRLLEVGSFLLGGRWWAGGDDGDDREDSGMGMLCFRGERFGDGQDAISVRPECFTPN
jgi:hypothetical protein